MSKNGSNNGIALALGKGTLFLEIELFFAFNLIKTKCRLLMSRGGA